jgi:hypothetical protein
MLGVEEFLATSRPSAVASVPVAVVSSTSRERLFVTQVK